MNTVELENLRKLGRAGIRMVLPLSPAALEVAEPLDVIDWLAGFGVSGAVGYDANADLILAALPADPDVAAPYAERLAILLAETLSLLARDHKGKPPDGYPEGVLQEAFALAQHLAVPEILAEPLVEFYEAARGHVPSSYLPATKRQLATALQRNQPRDLNLPGREGCQDVWQDIWLHFLVGKDVPLEGFRDEVFWFLLLATFGDAGALPLREQVPEIRSEAEYEYHNSKRPTIGRYLNAAQTISTQASRHARTGKIATASVSVLAGP